jgi:exodeoxyribonuclease V gamma subunit
MLLGHALPNPDGTLLFELADSPPIAPLDPIEGKAVEPLGRFIGAANLLFDFALDVSPRPLHAWRDRLVALVEALLIHDEPSRAHAEPIFAALHSLIERAPTDLSLDFDALSDLLAAHLPDLRTSASGAIAVGPLLPVRPPARVIALLGMDATRLPRRSRAPGFDLAEDAHQDTRADDRHAILAALSSARDHLIVIYTGYRPGDPRPIEPASPLRELLYRARDGADAIVRHPVEAHHPDHFDVSAPRSFDVDRLEAARILLRRRQPRRLYRLGPPEPRDPTATPFALSDLVQAIAHPARWTFRARLGFDLARIESHRQSLEPVELSPLGRWALRDRLLAWRLAGLSPEACLQSLVATGDLPLGAAGALEFDALMRDVERLTRAALARMPHAAPRRRHVSLTLGGVRLTGSIDDAVEGLLRARAGNLKASDLLTAWVEHLALAATLRQPIESHLVHLDTVATLAPIAPSAAREALFDLLRLATRSRALPTPLFPATSLAWFDWQLRQSTPAVPDFVKHAWLRDSRLRTGDATDPHVALLFEAALGDDTFPFENLDFQTISREVFGPLLAAVSRRPLP